MRIYTTITERTVRRTFREHKFGRSGLTVFDRNLPAFALKITPKDTRTFIVRVVNARRQNRRARQGGQYHCGAGP